MMNKKVLVVDNHPLMLQFMRNLLSKEGHEVVTANDGLSALDMLQNYTPEVIFTDLIMPNIDGERLCRIIRTMPALQQVRLIVLSAVAAEESIDYQQLGAHACIAKGPFNQMAEHILTTMQQLGTSDDESSAGAVMGLDGVYPREITKELLSVKKHFELVLGSMAEGVLEISPQSRIIYANPVAVRVLSLPEERLLGSSFPEQFQGEAFGRVKELIENLEDTPLSVPDSSPLALGDRQVTLTLLPVEGLTCRAIVILNDVTHRKLLEVRLLQSQTAETAWRLAEGMIQGFSNTLTAVTGNLSLAMNETGPKKKLFERIQSAEQAIHRAKGLTQQLMALSRGGEPIKHGGSIVELVRDTCISVLRDPEIRCELSLPPDLWWVEVDAAQFRQAVYTLLRNAVEAMPRGGVITITADNHMMAIEGDPPLRPGKYLKLSIQDQGPGIAAQDLPKLFDPSFTAESSWGPALSTVQSIIQRHSGLITATSEENVGTTIDIYLPAIDTAVSSPEQTQEDILSGTGRILLIDDDGMIRETTEQMLAHLGYSVFFARDGQEALVHYVEAREAQQPFDAVIIDISTPYGKSGKETLEDLLKIDPDTKAIASSCQVYDPAISSYKDQGFAGVLVKPYQLRDLGAVLHHVIHSSGS
jgi:two-component system, cell cycle sensor histidine kinase and response regulator CckA